jgi:hydrogenase maturation protein HypF
MTDQVASQIGFRIEIRGQVQGVGFRPWVYRLATAAGIRGRVWNHAEGVTIEAFGTEDALRVFARTLASPPAPAAHVRSIDCEPIPVEPVETFSVVASRAGGHRSPSIPPDWATCELCLRELQDAADRRHRYPFSNCTHCGPRYTICRDVPYDRPQTTMATFHMCADCRREYDDPGDRRFHAEPNACPACGPRLTLTDAVGRQLDGDPIAGAAALLRDGSIVAVKGLGGFHLACDATSAAAVGELRRRKRRDEKPFAVMVRTVADAEQAVQLGEPERALLTAGERPIVLAERRRERARERGRVIVPDVAPGNPWLGLMLPYTPLHALLLAAVERPLVMTSANFSDEPMAYDNADALQRLATVADFFLMHDREIANRCDDSVARVIDGRRVVFRRGRGYVPTRLRLPHPVRRPLLACGAHLKNTFCLAQGDAAWLGPHIGDLETDEACRAFEESVERFQRFVGITPEVIAHDLHPDYFTTHYALARRDLRRVGVQHHHAHIVACMVEHHLAGPVIGLAWDGTGYGLDGTAWGGELLVVTSDGFEHIATFRPIPLAGGDRAIQQVWRIALALLDQAFDGDPPLDRLPAFAHIDRCEIEQVRRMIATSFNSPAAHGVGRFFDAFGVIALGKTEARYEGQVAVELAGLADASENRAYPFGFEPGPVIAVDLRPATRAAVADILGGSSAATVSGRFHAMLVNSGVEMVCAAAQRTGRLPVVLSGGCFQNPRLVEGLRHALAPRFEVFSHERVPPGDGGIALGQAVIADAIVRKGL